MKKENNKKTIKEEKKVVMVIDASNATLGRLASFAAKQALLGKNIAIVNCENIIISGNRKDILHKYSELRKRGGHALNGPNFPSIPYMIVKRTIRGMLTYKYGRGSDALDRIRCYNDIPAEYANSPKIKTGKEKIIKSIKLSELSQQI